jgi:mannose-6-phosphate isomerase-like protein (cupin superfamily)
VDAFELEQVAAERARLGTLYVEFLRTPALSVGLYVLHAGQEDPQQPHTEDEVYHVVRGRATIRVGEEDRPVGPGSVVYVAAGVPHRFHSIEEQLELLVVFAPAQHTNRPADRTT